jgi:hypothetical protein
MVSIMSHEPSASFAQLPRNTLSAIYLNPHQLKDSLKVIKRILSWKYCNTWCLVVGLYIVEVLHSRLNNIHFLKSNSFPELE